MMVNFPRKMDSEKGIALIAAVLAIAVLLAISLSFSFNMRLEEKAAGNYMSSLQARYVAEAGIQYAVAKLKNDADPSGIPLLSYATTEYDQLGDAWNLSSQPAPTGSIDFGKGVVGTYTVTVVDTARRIYLNDNNPNLGTVLESLVTVLINAGKSLQTNDGSNIYNNRPALATGGYITKKQIMVVNGSTINAVKYDALKDYLSAYGYVRPALFNGTAPVNINTADQYMLQAVIGSIPGVISSAGDRDKIVQAILEYRTGREYNTATTPWTETSTIIGAGKPNPFDGLDTNRGDDNGTLNDGVDLDPIVAGFDTDGLDNDGDPTTPVGSLSSPSPKETYLFAGGARGEFDALIDYISKYPYRSGSLGIISSGAAVKNNADPDLPPVFVGLDFQSKFFKITSTGTITQGNEKLAESKIVRIVEREK